MSNTLVDPPDLAAYPGAPFNETVVDAAVGTVGGGGLRGDVGWHIAPELTETITVDGSPDKNLILPTLRIVTVTAVRDVTGTTPAAITGWKIKAAAGILTRDEGWPQGSAAIEVDLTHGFTQTPAELLPAVAWYAQQQTIDATLSSSSMGGWSEAYSRPASTFRSPVGEYPVSIVAKFNVRTEA